VASANDLQLLEAVRNQNREAVRALLKQQVDVNAPQGDGATALHWAAHRDDLETADLLIRAGAKVNAATDLGVTPIALACANGSAAMVEKLLAAGANPNAVASGEPALMTAARSRTTTPRWRGFWSKRAPTFTRARTSVSGSSRWRTAMAA